MQSVEWQNKGPESDSFSGRRKSHSSMHGIRLRFFMLGKYYIRQISHAHRYARCEISMYTPYSKQ